MAMMLAKRKCCCGGCTYFDAIPSSPAAGQVTFTSALDDDLLVPQSGTWDVDGSGNLRVTGPGKILVNVAQPDAVTRMRLVAVTGSYVNGSVIRLSIDYTDDNNRHYAEGYIDSTFGGGAGTTGKIAKVSGGSETVLYDDERINFYNSTFFGSTKQGSFCIQDYGTRFSTSGFDATIGDPITAPSTPVGGLYAAIEVEQGTTDVHTFTSIKLSKVGYPACPVPTCAACLPVMGCYRIPASGFLVDVSGVSDGPSSGYSYFSSGVAANFNASFVCDQISEYYYGTQFFETSPCYGPGYGSYSGQRYAWRSAVFALDPVIVYTESGYSFNYTHGRVILIPRETGDACSTAFDLILQISQSDNDTCLLWLWVAHVIPSTYSGDNVDADCTALDAATYSDNTATFPHTEVQENIVFTVTAL